MSKHAQRKGRISSRKIRRLVLISIILAVFALGAMAAVSLRANGMKNSTPQPNNAQTSDARATQRFRVGAPVPLNPQTGQIRPLTQEEAQRLAADLKQLVNQSTDGLQSVRHADGSVSMDLQGRFQNVAVAKLDEDGKLTQSCVDNPESAAAFFEIDPQLVGVNKRPSAPMKNNAAAKGELR
ncbi:MAG: hypothetical protein ABJA18_05950 [bacterium]